MASLNQCNFIGNLGKDPDIRYLPSGEAVANFSIACSEKWKDKSGETNEHTEWVRVVAFGKLADIIGEYLKKGAPVYLSCRMRTRKWKDESGNDRYSTEFVADKMVMLGGSSRGDSGDDRARQQADAYGKGGGAPQGGGSDGGFSSMPDDDIPFVDVGAWTDCLGQRLARRTRRA